MQQTYTPTELKSLRQRKGLTLQLQDKLIRDVLSLAGELMEQHPSVMDIPRDPQIRNTFLFRFALCASVSILKRIEEGGAEMVSDENLRNDMVDVNFAARGGPGIRDRMAAWLRWILGSVTPPISSGLPA